MERGMEKYAVGVRGCVALLNMDARNPLGLRQGRPRACGRRRRRSGGGEEKGRGRDKT